MTWSQCDLFRELSQSAICHLIVAVKGLISLAGAIRVCLQWRQYGVRFLVHENTKIMFQFYYALNIFFASIFAFIYLSELIRCVGIAAVVSAQHIIFVLSIERLYSTIFPAHFERNSSKPLAIFLALSSV
ncbi:hypothetical protein PMAYCL1PPCAC_16723, partial [Pristionchus mayeri]